MKFRKKNSKDYRPKNVSARSEQSWKNVDSKKNEAMVVGQMRQAVRPTLLKKISIGLKIRQQMSSKILLVLVKMELWITVIKSIKYI